MVNWKQRDLMKQKISNRERKRDRKQLRKGHITNTMGEESHKCFWTQGDKSQLSEITRDQKKKKRHEKVKLIPQGCGVTQQPLG